MDAVGLADLDLDQSGLLERGPELRAASARRRCSRSTLPCRRGSPRPCPRPPPRRRSRTSARSQDPRRLADHAGLSPDRFMTQLEMTTSTLSSGSGMSSMSPLRNSTFPTPACSALSSCELEHLVGHVEADRPAGGPDPRSRRSARRRRPPSRGRAPSLPLGGRRPRSALRSRAIQRWRRRMPPRPGVSHTRPRRTPARHPRRSARPSGCSSPSSPSMGLWPRLRAARDALANCAAYLGRRRLHVIPETVCLGSAHVPCRSAAWPLVSSAMSTAPSGSRGSRSSRPTGRGARSPTIPASRSFLRWCESVGWEMSNSGTSSHTHTLPACFRSTSTSCRRIGSPRAFATSAIRVACSRSTSG